MRLLSFVVVALVLTVAASAPAGDAVKDEMKKLEGTWVVQSFSEKGKVNEEMKGTELTFAGANLTLKMKKGDEQKEMKATYKIDPTKKPKTIDVLGEGKKHEMRAIYQLEGDTLRVCHGVKEEERPTDFTDENVVIVTLKRKK
jgi:uncharacterized protein (TIGR03067 family)